MGTLEYGLAKFGASARHAPPVESPYMVVKCVRGAKKYLKQLWCYLHSMEQAISPPPKSSYFGDPTVEKCVRGTCSMTGGRRYAKKKLKKLWFY